MKTATVLAVIASAHGRDADQVAGRPFIGSLLRRKLFDRYIVLSDAAGIGTVEAVIAAGSGDLLVCRKNGVKACG